MKELRSRGEARVCHREQSELGARREGGTARAAAGRFAGTGRAAAEGPQKDAKGRLAQTRRAQEKLNKEIEKLPNTAAPQARAKAEAASQQARQAAPGGTRRRGSERPG